jgi:hypothetical protein
MTSRNPIRVYADTSVYGGVFDDEYAEPSRRFFDAVRAGELRLVVSPVVWDELRDAPDAVRRLFDEYRDGAEVVDVSEEAVRLQQAYLKAAILGPKWQTDALHVALATIARCRLLVSWNFKHIVSFKKIPLDNGVNLASGYEMIGVHTPQEVILDEDQDV